MSVDYVAIGSICVAFICVAYYLVGTLRRDRRAKFKALPVPVKEQKLEVVTEAIPTSKLIELDLHRRLHEFRNTKFARLPQRNNVIPFHRPSTKKN